jgi:hypothetical protein
VKAAYIEIALGSRVAGGIKAKKASGSFLKKSTKKLLLIWNCAGFAALV